MEAPRLLTSISGTRELSGSEGVGWLAVTFAVHFRLAIGVSGVLPASAPGGGLERMGERGLAVRAARTVVLIVGAVVWLGSATIEAAELSPEELLAGLHPDYDRFVSAIRVVSLQAASVSPAGIYSGLVRPGGKDPRILSDTPLPGGRNEIILYPDAIDPARGTAWLRLILDHEHFHARHLAGAAGVPLVDFGEAGANSAYYEALAWGYVLERARAGTYGPMKAADLREVTAAARRHYDAFRSFVEGAQPAAWLHYGRFLRDPEAGESSIAGATPIDRPQQGTE